MRKLVKESLNESLNEINIIDQILSEYEEWRDIEGERRAWMHHKRKIREIANDYDLGDNKINWGRLFKRLDELHDKFYFPMGWEQQREWIIKSAERYLKESLNENDRIPFPEEDIDVVKLKDELKTIRGKLRYLSQVHHPLDDNPLGSGTVRDARNKLNNRKKQIMNLLETPEDFEKRAERKFQASQKRYAKQKEKRREKEEKLKKLTPKQEAINRIIDLQYQIRMMKSGPHSISNKDFKDKYKEIEELKDEFNIKSYDLRRQKEYDPGYE